MNPAAAAAAAARPVPPPPPGAPVRGSRTALGLGLLAAVVLLAAGGYLAWQKFFRRQDSLGMRITRDPELARIVDQAVERGHNPLSSLSTEYIRREVERRKQLEAARQQEERGDPAASPAAVPSSSSAPAKASSSSSPSSAPASQPAAAPPAAGRGSAPPATPRSEPPARPREIAQAQLPPPSPASSTATAQTPPPAPAPAVQNTPAPAAAPPSRPSILKPERDISPTPPRPSEPAPRTPPPAPVPSSGVLVWSGELRKGEIITIEGGQASSGTLQGALPGVPVILETDYKGIGFAEMPGPSNGWKRVAFRALRDQKVVITLRWKTFD